MKFVSMIHISSVFQRCRMNEDTGVDYMRAMDIGETVQGLGGVGVVVHTKNPEFIVGNIVHSAMNWPWTVFFNATPSQIFPVSKVKLEFQYNRNICEKFDLHETSLGASGKKG